MFVKVRTLGGVTFNVLVQGKATILDLKKKLPTPPSYLKNISLVYKGNELPDFMPFHQLEFSETDFLVVVFNKKRHREARDKENQKETLSGLVRKQPRLLIPTSSIRGGEEEATLRNLRRRRNVRLHVGSSSPLPTSSLGSSPPHSLADFPWARAFDNISSGSESSDQETPSTRSRHRLGGYLGTNHTHTEDDLIDFDGDGGNSSSGSSGGGRASGLGRRERLNPRGIAIRDIRDIVAPSSPTYQPLRHSSLDAVTTSSLSETLSRSQREMKSATEAILERMHQKRALAATTSSLSETPKFKVDEDKLAQLGTMGFRKPAATRALLLHRNNVEASVVWLLENSASPRINEPISAQELATLSRAHPFFALHPGHGLSLSSSSPVTSTQTNGSSSTSSSSSARSGRHGRTRATRASFSDYMGLVQLDNFNNFFEMLPSHTTATTSTTASPSTTATPSASSSTPLISSSLTRSSSFSLPHRGRRAEVDV